MRLPARISSPETHARQGLVLEFQPVCVTARILKKRDPIINNYTQKAQVKKYSYYVQKDTDLLPVPIGSLINSNTG